MPYRPTPHLQPNGLERPAPFAPPAPDADRTRKSSCRQCGRPLAFITMESGNVMPCDPSQIYGDGYRTLVERYVDARSQLVGRVVKRAGENVLGFQPHFGTCPCRKRKVIVKLPGLFDGLDG